MEVSGKENVKAINSVANVVRAKSLELHYEQILLSRKRTTYKKLKDEIEVQRQKNRNIKLKKKNYSMESHQLSQDFKRSLKLYFTCNHALAAMKQQLIAKKDNVAEMEISMEKALKDHEEKWKRTEAEWLKIPRVREYEALQTELKELTEKESLMYAKSKELKALAWKEFQDEVVRLAKRIVMSQKLPILKEQKQRMEKKLKELKMAVEKRRSELQEQQKRDDHIEEPVVETVGRHYPSIDFFDLDESTNMSYGSQEMMYQESVVGDLEAPDNITLADSPDQSYMSSGMPTLPVARSTPYAPDRTQPEPELSPLDALTPTEKLDINPNPEVTKPADPVQPTKVTLLVEPQVRSEPPQVQQKPLLSQPQIVINSEPAQVISQPSVISETSVDVDNNQMMDTYDDQGDDEDVDYQAMYAKSPDDPRLSDTGESSPARPPVQSYFPASTPNQPQLSLFNFGPSEPKAGSSIFNLF